MAAAQLTLEALLAPSRLERVLVQHAVDPGQLGLGELLDRIEAATLPPHFDAVSRRIFYRFVATLARTALDPAVGPEVAAAADARLRSIGARLTGLRGDDRDWGKWLAQQIADPAALAKLAADRLRAPSVPPGMPIGGAEPEWMDGS